MDFKAVFERTYPYLTGAATAAAAVRYGAVILSSGTGSGVDFRQVASAGLNVFGLLTGLLFSVYVLAIAPGGGFIERIFHTGTFAIFRRYVLEAMLLGAFATVIVIPPMATSVDPKIWVWSTAYLAACCGIGFAALAAFVRVAHVFLVWVGISSRSVHRSR